MQTCFQFGLFRGGEGSSNILAQGGSGAGQAQRTRGMGLGSRGACETLQQAGNSAFMIQLLENSYAFLVKRMDSGIIPLFLRQVPQIGERSGNAPAVTEFAKNYQALFV